MSKNLKILGKLYRNCEKDKRFKPLIAHCLGYGSTGVIDQWFQRGYIPQNTCQKLEELLDARIKVTID